MIRLFDKTVYDHISHVWAPDHWFHSVLDWMGDFAHHLYSTLRFRSQFYGRVVAPTWARAQPQKLGRGSAGPGSTLERWPGSFSRLILCMNPDSSTYVTLSLVFWKKVLQYKRKFIIIFMKKCTCAVCLTVVVEGVSTSPECAFSYK